MDKLVYTLSMRLIACGFNHETAPISVRERVAFSSDETVDALKALLSRRVANEALILSTCNRTEVYADADDPGALSDWLAMHRAFCHDELSKHLYAHQEQHAVQHMMRVATGLDSMVVGEPQILGQLKQAYDLARSVGAVGVQLERLLQTVFAVSKQVRSGTSLGSNSLSIAYAAVNLAKHIFEDLSKARVLLVGAGEMIDIAAMHLCNQGVKRLVVANRTVEKAEQLASKFGAHAVSISDIPLYLKDTDVIITATASPLPIFGKGAVETALKVRKHRPIFIVDIAMPRDVEPEVGELEDIYLYHLDDLKDIVSENLKHRQTAARQAEAIIELQVQHFMREWQALKGVNMLRAYRNKVENICDEAASEALRKFGAHGTVEDVVAELTRAISRKIMHDPTVELRQAAYDGQIEVLKLAQRLFGV